MNRWLPALWVLVACDPRSLVPPPPDGPPPAVDGDVAFHTCPMHPSIQQPGPGSCPICGMYLTPVSKAELEKGAVRVDAGRRAKFGIATSVVGLRAMSREVELPAVVSFDRARVAEVTPRVSGFLEEVAVGVVGERVREGQVLVRLYAPDAVAALDDLARAQAATDAGAVRRAGAARQRLLRWGFADSDLAAVLAGTLDAEKLPLRAPRGGVIIEQGALTGAMVSPGQTLFRIADLREVSLDVAVPVDDLSLLPVGAEVRVRSGGGEPRTGKVSAINPSIDAATRTARVRVDVQNTDGGLLPDQWATVTVSPPQGERLAVPEGAVVYTGPRQVVFVDEGSDLLVPREVTTGLRHDGYVEVLTGVQAGEAVVTSGNFLVAADSRLKRGGEADLSPPPEAGHDHAADHPPETP